MKETKKIIKLCDAECCGFDSDGIEHSSFCSKEKGHDGDHESFDGIEWTNEKIV